MALKSTIYKADLQVSNMDSNYYAAHSLTIAKHPSETDERLMVRLIAFALFASDSIAFGKGLSDDEEPDLWQKDLTGAIEIWIEVGFPDERVLRKASGRSNQVILLMYGGRSADIWWDQNNKALLKLNNLTVINLPKTDELTNAAARNMNLSCTIQDNELLITHDIGSFTLLPIKLK
jgi:uncharacterized protein YaeQ